MKEIDPESISHKTSLLIVGALKSQILLALLATLASLSPPTLKSLGFLEEYTWQTWVIMILGVVLIWFFVVGLIYRFYTKAKIAALIEQISELKNKVSTLSLDLTEAKNNRVVIRRGNANNSLGNVFRR
ncbi:MAG: hypothetical protein QM483_00175 [Desulfuromusa sp.]